MAVLEKQRILIDTGQEDPPPTRKAEARDQPLSTRRPRQPESREKQHRAHGERQAQQGRKRQYSPYISLIENHEKEGADN